MNENLPDDEIPQPSIINHMHVQLIPDTILILPRQNEGKFTIFKIKCIMGRIRIFDLLACPANEHFIIHIGLDCQTLEKTNSNSQC